MMIITSALRTIAAALCTIFLVIFLPALIVILLMIKIAIHLMIKLIEWIRIWPFAKPE